jgi:hypothetical protein
MFSGAHNICVLGFCGCSDVHLCHVGGDRQRHLVVWCGLRCRKNCARNHSKSYTSANFCPFQDQALATVISFHASTQKPRMQIVVCSWQITSRVAWCSYACDVQILAIGIGMQDLVTNLGVAKAGLSRMAAVACLGSPLLNVQMGL